MIILSGGAAALVANAEGGSSCNLYDKVKRVKDQIKNLEKRVDDLIQLCQDLRKENSKLQNAQSVLFSEQARLTESNRQASEKLGAIIKRLKSME